MGRRAARFRRAIVFFLCTAALFGWAMGALGRRGFGETSSIHSLAYAVPIEGENYDVTQWVNVFVIHGGYYDLRHGDDNDVYATCESLEPVNGIIENGAGGRFYVDIPLFSNRPFLHRARMRGHALGLGVLEWRQKRGLEALTLSVGPGFPADLVEAWVLHGDRVLPMEREGDTLRLGSGRRWSLKEFLSEQRLGLSRLYVGVSANQSADPREAAKEMVPVLIARALGGTTDVSYGFTLPQPPDDEAQVFLLTKSPPDFALQGEGLGSESGYVLYHVRLHRPEDSDG
jgi:hypothetical protein